MNVDNTEECYSNDIDTVNDEAVQMPVEDALDYPFDMEPIDIDPTIADVANDCPRLQALPHLK